MKYGLLKYTLLGLGLVTMAGSARALDLAVTPGTLGATLQATPLTETTLTLTGAMDARDFSALQDQGTSLLTLDLSGVTIAPYRPARPMSATAAEYAANELPDGALLGLRLTSLTLPANLTVIGNSALAGNQFTTLALPATLTRIGDNALYGCTALTELTLPSAVNYIGSYALASCPALTSVDMGATAITALPANVMTDDAAISTLTLPTALASIGRQALAGTTALSSVTLPASLREIGESAFYGSGLTTVTIPSGVTTVGDFAFAASPALTQATVGDDTQLSRGMFALCPEFVTLTATGLTQFPDYLFAKSVKTDVQPLLSDVAEIGDYALLGNTAQTLTLGNTLVYLGEGAMQDMAALKEIDAIGLGTNVPELGDDVFTGIDQENTTLKVAQDASEPWMAADQWKAFKISAVTASTELHQVQPTVSARFEDKTLRITATSPITDVQIYTADGKTIASLRPNALNASADTSGMIDRVYVVRVQTADGQTSTFKLMR